MWNSQMFLAYHKYNKNVPVYWNLWGTFSTSSTVTSGLVSHVAQLHLCVQYISLLVLYLYSTNTHIGGIGTWPSYSIAIIPDWVLAHVQPSTYPNTLQCTKYGLQPFFDWLCNIFEWTSSYWKRLVLQWKHISWHMCCNGYYCRSHFLVSALYVFVHARYTGQYREGLWAYLGLSARGR